MVKRCRAASSGIWSVPPAGRLRRATALPVCSIRMGLRRSQVADLWASCQKTMLASLADEARFSILCASQVPQREPRQLAPVSSITACRWGLTCVPIVRDQGRFAQISAGLSNTSLAGVRASGRWFFRLLGFPGTFRQQISLCKVLLELVVV